MGKRKQKVTKHSASKNRAVESMYDLACRAAEKGNYTEARRTLVRLERMPQGLRRKALVANDLGVLAAAGGDLAEATQRFRAALTLDGSCEPARLNLAVLEAEESRSLELSHPGQANGAAITSLPPRDCTSPKAPRIKVAILSFLFNWPSTGGGIVHTVELSKFLAEAGYDVRHIYARYPAWRIGGVTGEPPLKSEILEFDERTWNVPAIQARFRVAVDAFGPDYVIITDSWNMKPVLAEAMSGYAYIMRLQAMECLCPLNNLRLLPEPSQSRHALENRLPQFRQCPLNQLANPGQCQACVRDNGRWSGDLHRLERGLAGVDTPLYHQRLLRSMRDAHAVLVVNPLIEELLKPIGAKVRVVTAGMDASRFPLRSPRSCPERPPFTRILFAGLVEEPSKGFHVLQEACSLLWQRRRDFELVATADPAGQAGPFTRFTGWRSQEELPDELYAADMIVLPALGQEALGRTAVEAMAAGRAVVASRIGGLQVTVVDGVTGLLCEPGHSADLAAKIEMLLDDRQLRERMGQAGRRRFEEEYSWDVIIERHYRPLLSEVRGARR